MLPPIVATLAVPAWRRAYLFAVVVGGSFAGVLALLVEAHLRFGGILERVHCAGEIQGVTLAMQAHAFLAVLAVLRTDEHAHRPAPNDLILLTCNGIKRLFISFAVRPDHGPAHQLRWSCWRRRHQARSRASPCR